jgi:hypothetical protein
MAAEVLEVAEATVDAARVLEAVEAAASAVEADAVDTERMVTKEVSGHVRPRPQYGYRRTCIFRADGLSTFQVPPQHAARRPVPVALHSQEQQKSTLVQTISTEHGPVTALNDWLHV